MVYNELMAGLRPTFITGAAAKIRLNGKTIAFCQDFNCSVQILTQTPKVLGKYEGDSVEPLGYLVSGSFSLVRYAKGIVGANRGAVPTGLAENDAGNGVGNWGTVWGGKLGDMLARNGVGSDGRANEALDPSKLAAGTTFDIQVYQKVDGEELLGILNIRNARITQADFGMHKRSPATERFTFVALYADGDSFVANATGVV
jgi:hypothetical protein